MVSSYYGSSVQQSEISSQDRKAEYDSQKSNIDHLFFFRTLLNSPSREAQLAWLSVKDLRSPAYKNLHHLEKRTNLKQPSVHNLPRTK